MDLLRIGFTDGTVLYLERRASGTPIWQTQEEVSDELKKVIAAHAGCTGLAVPTNWHRYVMVGMRLRLQFVRGPFLSSSQSYWTAAEVVDAREVSEMDGGPSHSIAGVVIDEPRQIPTTRP